MLCPQCIQNIAIKSRQHPSTLPSYATEPAVRSGIENTTHSWQHFHPPPDRIANDSDGIQNISSPQSSSWTSASFSFEQGVQSTETTLTSSSSSRSKLKCDRCSTKKIVCSNIIPCRKCITDQVLCTISPSRRRDPGTCGECFRRKIPCVGEGNICYGCIFYQTPCLPKESTSNPIPD